ncbi:MAG: hypothetical protein UU08_C0003G0010 [Candidatus Uhrbacteria bacterium GW2011_GWE2_40_58]|nr:MAG: hypothetical protein UT94_C0004G0010 [Candidatus Uhrbacteria bacterium GW2011_GWF2_40_263]KKR68087.1 MAG: hypothetical protein UU08_C0003G0010 [Candidatus Uhrbacteria bacterium GW2011_GWE2_40_58]OGL91788.1 MAG: hypothetical protein A2239_04485 [Candidatus Uhrbacteria bacterium RIFOXYA2_FULL_40_9]OGL97238.1 MAG: hypothetical protein A2332_01460 [Candidatus Uhrbacteria bacterium RIFOXYB2_FULL_41_18]HBK34455.1 hypothetical protein [Candidatus Uhrbacteria bacterium]
MRLVATVQGHRILSDLRVVSKTESKITFADGSYILLDSLVIVNEGSENSIVIEDPDRYGEGLDEVFDVHPEESLWHDGNPEDDEDEDEDEEDWGDVPVRERDEYDEMWEQLEDKDEIS